jgi:hypothetical protein
MLPPRVPAGQTLSLTISESAYPATAGWSMRLILSPATVGPVLSINSTASGSDHVVTASAAATAAWAPGGYVWEVWAIQGAEQYRVAAGSTVVEAGLIAGDTWKDHRTQAEKNLQAIEDTLAGKADSGTQFYVIAGRQLQSYPLAELRKLRDDYRREVASERTAARFSAGLGDRRRLAVRM